MKRTLITAGIHGNEIGSVLIAREIKGWIESRGIEEVEVLPNVNLEAVEHKQRKNPLDDKDLNRIFPGKENGTTSERRAHRLFEKAKEFDRLIDLHTYGDDSWCIPYMLTDLNQDYNRKLCERVGLKTAVQTRGTDSQLFLETSNIGIPSMIIEAGGAQRYREELEEVKKTMIDLLTAKKTSSEKPSPKYFEHYDRKRSSIEGYFEPVKEPGDEVKNEEVLGTIDGEEIRADFSGLILGMKESSSYDPEEESIAAIAKK